MPRVVPSQVVSLLDQSYGQPPQGRFGPLDFNNGSTLDAIANLIDQIPSELITLNAADYNALTACSAAMKDWVARWRIGGNVGTLDKVRGYQGQHVLTLLRAMLVKCPDEAPAAQTVGLDFIADEAYRNQLRTDISAAYSAERNGEWKAATVLGGSVVEALLLWALQQQIAQQVTAAADNAQKAGFPIKPAEPLERWALAQYIEVAARMNVISADTATQARLTKDFRNLIHPGRAVRLGQQCSRATALTALAGIEHVVDDLT